MTSTSVPTANPTTPSPVPVLRRAGTAVLLALAVVGAGAVGSMVGDVGPSQLSSAEEREATHRGSERGESEVGTSDDTDSSWSIEDGDGDFDESSGSAEGGSWESAASDIGSGEFDEFDDDGGDGGDLDASDDAEPTLGSDDYDAGSASYDEGEEYGDTNPTTTNSDDLEEPGPSSSINDGADFDPDDEWVGAEAGSEHTIPSTTSTSSVAPRSSNLVPTLPVRTIEKRIPVGQRVDLFDDASLAAGWSDPEGTADWLCLTFTPERRDWWLDGADCEGKGLWARVSTPGVYVVDVRVREATAASPGGVGPTSRQGITLRLIAE